MAPIRDQDRYRSPPISISSSSLSPPPASRKKVISSAFPQGVANFPHGPSLARPHQDVDRGRTAQWVDALSVPNNTGHDVGHGFGSNDVNVGGQLVPQALDFTHNHDPPQASPAALAHWPTSNIAMPPTHGRPLARDPRLRKDFPYMSNDFIPNLPAQTLPFNVKHVLLNSMQNVMEEALFFWAKQWVPELLEREQWESPEAGELNEWVKRLPRYHLPPHAFSQNANMSLPRLQTLMRGKLHHIRHAAVHRLPTTTSMLKAMLADAQLLTNGLRDGLRSRKLRAIAVALDADDIKWMEALMAAPISDFKDPFDAQKFRTQTSPPGNKPQQKEGMEFLGRFNYAIERKDYGGASSGMSQFIKGQENTGQSHFKYQQSLGQPTTNSSAHERGTITQRGLRDLSVQPRGLKRKRSELFHFGRAKQQAGVIKHAGDHIDLTLDSDEDNPPATNPHLDPEPAKVACVIDLTGDESVALSRSPRAT